MQVATLFRETATLLGASMEAQDPPGVETQGFKFTDGPPATCSPNPPRDWFQSGPRKEFLGENENYCKTSRPTFLDGPVKIETQDDGYETSGDLELRTQVENQKFMNHLQGPHPANIKCEPTEDPYSFVDDDPTPAAQQHRPQSVVLQPIPKKRGRKKKNCLEGGLENAENLMNGDPLMKKKLKEGKFIPIFKERKKHDRFNGMSEEEVSKRTLPDHLALNLDIVIIGINPGLFAAYKGHHYAGPGNHFWKCLYLSGLTPEPMTADDDYKLLQVGIGFTNMVARATKGSADLTRKEIKEGSQILLEKLQKFKPKIAVFNGKLIFEVFSGKKDFSFGRQPEFVDGTNTYMWVMPSSSARCAQLPRAADKVPFYAALKKFRDYLNGIITDLDETEVVFTDSKLKNYFEPELKDEPKEEHSFYGYGRMPNDELTDLSNAVMKKEDQPPAKKKRGRPKKIKSDCVEVKKTSAEPPKKEPNNVCEVPKKKRGRPKKIKTEDVMPNTNGIIDHTNSSTTVSNCFSPPIQSPSSYGQQNFSPSYGGHSHSYSQHPSQSPSEIHNYHHSPVPSQQHYTQSPQPPSQSFTHSDLSSEISAAISSEHNLGSPSPTSPSLGPPDFEPPSSMPEETNDGQQQSAARTPKEEVMGENNQNPNECRFSSPAPPNDSNNMGYPNYGNFQTSPDNHSVLGYTGTEYNAKRNLNQDVSSKSLSGLESLVDQIPSIADGEAPHSTIGNGNVEEQFSNGHIPTSQFNDNSGYLGGYSSGQQYSAANGQNSNNYSPHYTSSNSNYSVSTSNSYSLHHSNGSMNFSVTSLANSSTAVNHEAGGQVSSSFSVSSLASNYTPMNSNVNSYPNLIGAPHPMAGHVVSSANGMFGNGMSGGIMERACGMGSSMGTLGSPVGLHNPMSMGTHSLPYPYGQYSHSAPPYAGASGGSFQYPPAHSLHVPSPNYPYPSPYSNSTYPQPSYLPNHMLDRLKQDRMDIGFGSF